MYFSGVLSVAPYRRERGPPPIPDAMRRYYGAQLGFLAPNIFVNLLFQDIERQGAVF
jgi:hypothetical protein